MENTECLASKFGLLFRKLLRIVKKRLAQLEVTRKPTKEGKITKVRKKEKV